MNLGVGAGKKVRPPGTVVWTKFPRIGDAIPGPKKFPFWKSLVVGISVIVIVLISTILFTYKWEIESGVYIEDISSYWRETDLNENISDDNHRYLWLNFTIVNKYQYSIYSSEYEIRVEGVNGEMFEPSSVTDYSWISKRGSEHATATFLVPIDWQPNYLYFGSEVKIAIPTPSNT